MKQVQIDEDLFIMLCQYFADGDESLKDDITSALSEKLDKLIARKLFTEYKQASPEQREAARQRYLDHAQISPSFRSENESSF